MSKQHMTHLLPEERILWQKFLDIRGGEYLYFEYDRHVGTIPPELKLENEADEKQARSIYLRRIDVLGFQPGVITIFEVGPHAGLYKFGQVIGYLEMFEEFFAPPEDLRGAIVTYLISDDVKRLFEKHGIDVYIMQR